MTFDTVKVMETIDHVCKDYERRRIDEIFGSQRGASRLNTEGVLNAIGKGQACKELRGLLFNAFGIGGS